MSDLPEGLEFQGHYVPGPVYQVPDYDPRSGEHCWVILVAYRVYPLKYEPGELSLLDRENLISMQGPGCYWCEETYTDRLAHRRCPGESKDD